MSGGIATDPAGPGSGAPGVAAAEGPTPEAVRPDLPDCHLYHGVAAMIYGQLGRHEHAEAAARTFMELHPTFVANVGAELRKRNFSPEDRAHILDGLRKAGVAIPGSALG